MTKLCASLFIQSILPSLCRYITPMNIYINITSSVGASVMSDERLLQCMHFGFTLSIDDLYHKWKFHHNGVIVSAMASQFTSITIVYSTVNSGADQSKHQSSALLAFVWGIHRGSVNSPHKGPVTRKMFPFDDAIILSEFDMWNILVCNSLWTMEFEARL